MSQQQAKVRSNKNIAIIAVAVVVFVWIIIGAVVLGTKLGWLRGLQSIMDINMIGGPTKDGNQVISVEEVDTEKVVKAVSPSVVSIITTQSSGVGRYLQEVEGAGTGIVISQDGYVLTNRHVVNGARGIQIVTSDGTRYRKVVNVGFDPTNDIAFLKIDNAKDLQPAVLGDSSTVRVGQRVIAIGNSLGQFQNTVTSGIISGLGRPITAATDAYGSNPESLTDLIQTDAAINPGNSGGPLINMAGQVVGINTAVVATAQGLGFAIPINAAKGLIRGVLKDGTIQKAYLGVQYLSITPEMQKDLSLSEGSGALLRAERGQSIVSGGPAAAAGLEEGDIITKVNDRKIGAGNSLGSMIAEFLPGEKISLTVSRGGKTKQVEATLGSFPSS